MHIPIESTGEESAINKQGKDQDMGINNITEDIILVELPSKEQRRSDEIKAVNEVVSNSNDSDILMDFSRVEIMNSWDISNLLILQNLLSEAGHRLVFFNVGTVTKCIFVVAGVTKIFAFAENRAAALEAIGKAGFPTNSPK